MYPGNKVLRQFFATKDDNDTDYDDQKLADRLDEAMFHLSKGIEPDLHGKDDCSFPYMATVDNVDNYDSFIAQLQSIKAIKTRTKSAKKRLEDTFEGVMIVSSAARGGTSKNLKYNVYCRATDHKFDIDTAKAAVCYLVLGQLLFWVWQKSGFL